MTETDRIRTRYPGAGVPGALARAANGRKLATTKHGDLPVVTESRLVSEGRSSPR